MVEARFRFEGRCLAGENPKELNPKVTPDFFLREFIRRDKTFFIHPSLILTLQSIRYLVGQEVKVAHVDEGKQGTRGFCASVRCGNLSELKRVCSMLLNQGALSKLTPGKDSIFLEARPSPTETISLEEALDVAFHVNSGYETSGDPFQQVTGNFNGAGLSFGPSQVNFKTGTLVQLFRRLEKVSRDILVGCFSARAHWDEWRGLWDKPVEEQILWGDQHSAGRGKREVKDPWRGYLKRVGQVVEFRQEMVAFSKETYGSQLREALKWLRTVGPHPITDLRCFCALFDLCTQQESLDKAQAQIKARIEKEKPKNQREVVQIACEERARTADAPWQAACLSRCLGILYGAPVPAKEFGKTAKADNPYFSLLPEMEVQGIQKFIASA